MKKRNHMLFLITACLITIAAQPVWGAEQKEPLYTLTAPTMEGRFSYSEDGKTATLFAPGVNKETGWYDTNKYWDGKDGRLCWAASCSNVLAWYLDQCETVGNLDLSSYERDAYDIFEHFRENWNPLEGYDPLNGFAWYFTGNTTDGKKPSELLVYPSGGYLRSQPHCGESWSILDPVNQYSVVGNYEEKYPFVDDTVGFYYPGSPLYSLQDFSDTIREQLTYGASVINVSQEGVTATGGHAITLWGCDYNVETGLISRIYVTDSDDESMYPGNYLKELGIKARVPDREGICITGYYLPGSASPITKLTSSTLLYAYGVADDPETPDPGTPDPEIPDPETPDPEIPEVLPKECWILEDGFWIYRKADTEKAMSEFLKIGANTFYFDEQAHMVTGWKAVNRDWYYFYDSGRMLYGWQKIDGFWYYLKENGVMAKGWQKIGGNWFYFNGSGHMVTGWQKIGAHWFYFYDSGRMVTGWQKIGTHWFYFYDSGRMVTGWQKLGTNWFYFYNSGAMAADCWIDGFYVNASGAWVRGRS